jgi:hypothetical protein
VKYNNPVNTEETRKVDNQDLGTENPEPDIHARKYNKRIFPQDLMVAQSHEAKESQMKPL